MRIIGVALALACVVSACGSDDEGGTGGAAGTAGTAGTGGAGGTGGTGAGGSGGSGGGLPMTCTEGYPTIATPCAVENELCKACLPSWNCCDEIRCEGGKWAMKQSHSYCPADSGVDAASD